MNGAKIMKPKFSKVRMMKIENAKYSIQRPNPEWKNKGEKWITFALSIEKWDVGETYSVAYIPHIPIEIRQDYTVHNVIPTYWDLEQTPNAYNFYLSNDFRLNAKYKNPAHMLVGSKKNVDLSPIDDKEAILELLKLAHKIYDPPI